MSPNPALLTLPHKGAAALTLTHTGSAEGGAILSTPVTIASMPIGVASADRQVIVAIATDATTNFNRYVIGVTIGGVTATADEDTNSTTDPTAPEVTAQASIWRATVPTGESAAVVVSFNKTHSTVNFTAYAFASDAALVVSGTAIGNDGDADASVTVTPASTLGGYVIAVAGFYLQGGSPSVSGASMVNINTAKVAAHGPASAGSSTAVTFSDPGGTGGSRFRAAAVAYRKA